MRAMMDLAMNHGSGAVLLKDIARRQGISLKYLEQLVTPLRAAGLLLGVRGARGGYMLQRPPEEIVLAEILQALEGSLAPVDCAADNETCNQECNGLGYCATQELWKQIHDAVNQVLAGRTLKDLSDRQRSIMRRRSEAMNYYI